MNDLLRLMADLTAAGDQVVRRGRRATSRHLDQMRGTSVSYALSAWAEYGKGRSGSAGTIRAKMDRDNSQIVGYLFADGDGAFFQEHGTAHHPPQPALHTGVEAHVDAVADSIADIAERLL